jgi:hypothetical protein
LEIETKYSLYTTHTFQPNEIPFTNNKIMIAQSVPKTDNNS